jgi:hypothetical protein
MNIRQLLPTGVVLLWAATVSSQESAPLDQRPQPWVRRAAPILSARATKQDWCRIVCYSPHVIQHDGLFHLWYLGTSEASRSNNMVMGYAQSEDGVAWTEHPGNPILTREDVPWGTIIQTPYVFYDEPTRQFRMWFVSGDGVLRDEEGKITRNDQQLGYATSTDGIEWKVRAKPVFPSGRSPSLVREPGGFRMWMNSRPNFDKVSGSLYSNIYEFNSLDGLRWTRSEQPVLQPNGPARSSIYPFVIRQNDAWYMWYGCHVAGGKFEIFCAKSADGTKWDVDHEHPAFPAAEGKELFDSRYTSTPCIVQLPDRLLMYYSARDWQTEYIDAEGRKRRDGSSVYAHIGVAELRLER